MKVELKSEVISEEFMMMEGEKMSSWIHRKPYGIVAQIQSIKDEGKGQIPTEV